MNKQQLFQRLQDIEWDNFEVKTAQTDVPKDAWETVSAFANTSGGWVVFGVSQKKKVFEIVGVENPEKIENDMLTTLRSKTKFNVKLSPQANHLIHTDYFSPMKPRIRVFTNRIEFENPGSLPRPVEELLKADESLPRNPVLAKFFRIAKLCESAGYGFDKMLEWKKQTGNDVFFETTVYKTKFTFMLDTTKAIKEEGGIKSGMKIEESGISQPENSRKTDENDTNNQKK